MKQRRSALVDMVNRMGTVSFHQIKDAFPDVSDMTLRTDLKALDADRQIVRIHGGARSVEQIIGTDGLLATRTSKHADEKEQIARKAIELIKPNTTVFLDSGSTTTALAASFPDEPIMVFSSSITCAAELARLKHPSVYMTGGELDRYSMSLNGSQALSSVRTLSFDQYFMGITGYTMHGGVVCGSSEETSLKQTCIERADEVIALMDSSKVGRRSTFTVCDLDQIDIVVSDGKLPEDFLLACSNAGVEVL
ncbi:DeoR/GlpR family DNA-binding transcription regulator [Collinsella sp. AGMB00827]|uniref:DeoR/GlpR family DNA-binding transcription regulator n=1 Tax=Collinsella ureilytica TaxID=2869515 RepID=A0ABS7MIP4_9ACTN|nr:DeoR/GlpR family DNA-binding transcription regulator [Collinsella urealyticum]MBY4796898.1 DeoR/GlpR family DNA-binding transcription regulator [Collinsella urealyticum]